MRRLRHGDPSGFSLVELVIAAGVGAVVLLISGSILLHLYQEKKRADFQLALSEIRVSFQHAVLNSSSWVQSASSDPMMSCFSGVLPTSCLALSAMPPRDFKVYSGGQALFDSTSTTSGFTDKGQACSTYPSTDCVLKPLIRWTAQCNLSADPTCTSPLILVSLSYQTSVASWSSLNLNAYGFQISKATFGIQSANSCTGAVPVCGATQASICENGVWTCEEFGL